MGSETIKKYRVMSQTVWNSIMKMYMKVRWTGLILYNINFPHHPTYHGHGSYLKISVVV